MKIFWSLILLLVAGSLAWLTISGGQEKAARAKVTQAMRDARDARDSARASAAADAKDRAASQALNAVKSEPLPAPTPQAQAELDALLDVEPERAASPFVPGEAVNAGAQAPTAPTTPAAAPGGGAAAVTQGAGEFEVDPSTPETRADGSMLYDGRFVVKGQGTKENPYEVTWEMLLSAEEHYDPRTGKKKIPQRVAILHEKWVKVTGYIAFPMAVQQPRELLAMLNQWDGCCIGTPPTPYDAIEVRLAAPATGDNRYATFGSVTGRFEVKPYLVGDWLVGLYLMEDGAFNATEFGGFGS